MKPRESQLSPFFFVKSLKNQHKDYRFQSTKQEKDKNYLLSPSFFVPLPVHSQFSADPSSPYQENTLICKFLVSLKAASFPLHSFFTGKVLPDLGSADLFSSHLTAHCGSVVGSLGSVVPSDLPGSVVLFDLSLAASDYLLPSFVDSLPPGDRSDDSEEIFIPKQRF